jgi:hypothetical protein
MRKGGRHAVETQQAGELLVCAELARQGFLVTTFGQHVPKFDVLAVDKNLKPIPCQVKSCGAGGSWQSTQNKWMNVTYEPGTHRQIITPLETVEDPDLIFAMVEVGEKYGGDRFFILTKKQLTDMYYSPCYAWMKKHDFIRPKKWDSLHCALRPDELTPYENNWELFRKNLPDDP